jgi:predicted nucleic acid-binding protein
VILDASAAVELLLRTDAGQRVAKALEGRSIEAPDILFPEIASTLTALVKRGVVGDRRADQAIALLSRLPATVFPARELIGAVWALRHNFTAHDATYVALAQTLNQPLLTLDARLARATAQFTSVPIQYI